MARGLLKDNSEYLTALQEAIIKHRPPSDLRFLIAMYCMNGAYWKELVDPFKQQLMQDLNPQNEETLLIELSKIFNQCHIPLPEELHGYNQSVLLPTESYDLSNFDALSKSKNQ